MLFLEKNINSNASLTINGKAIEQIQVTQFLGVLI